MLKLIASKNIFAFATQYVIKNGSFLVQAPPQRAKTGYNLYIQKSFKSIKKSGSSPEKLKELAKRWNESPELQKSYNLQALKLNPDHKKQKEEYKQKFCLPFKPINYMTLAMKKVHTENKFECEKGQKIKSYAEKSQTAIKNLSQEQLNKIKQDSKQIKEQRNKLKEQFKFPEKEYPTFRIYSNRHYVELTKRTPNYEAQMKAAFEKYETQWKQSVRNWLKTNNYDITLQEFLVLQQKDPKKSSKKGKKVKKVKADVQDIGEVIYEQAPRETLSVDQLKRFYQIQSILSNIASPKTAAPKASRSAKVSSKSTKTKKAQQK